jgi:hypothetical protein
MPEMRQLNDGTWLNEETGVVVAPQGFAYAGGQNDVYDGPPLMPNLDLRNPAPPLPVQRRGVLPNVQAPVPQQPVAGFPGPQLAVSPFALGEMGDGVKKVLLVAGLVAITYVTVIAKNKINGKKKK